MFHRIAGSPLRRQPTVNIGGKTISACVFLLTLSGALNLWLINERLSLAHTQTHIIQQQELIVSTTVTEQPCPSVNCTSVCNRLKCRNPTLKQRTIGSLDAVSGVVGSAVADVKATANQISSPSESVTLFIGILSGRGYRHRRQAVRDAWASKCQVQGVSACRFVLSQEEVTPLVEEEMQQYQDIILVHGETNYKSILLKSLFVLEHAVTHYDARFILKTDDDAFVNVPAFVQQLRLLCESPDCRKERLYMGKQCRRGKVIMSPGHKWDNSGYYNHTGLATYANYMFGGGYIVSADVAKALVTMEDMVKLKFTPIEDATVGFWLMGMDIRQIDHPKMNTNFWPCCFKPPERATGGKPLVTAFQLDEETEADICSDDPWLILHKLDSPSKMRYIGSRFGACRNATSATVIPGSIAEWVSQTDEQRLRDNRQVVSSA
ncbi:hypothetical protein CVIRNUC_007571 [Coccomyxa viridis]|uniref:Hexosyltransferase n=1 Tax=Coccomyxa viridis TaxID=1274662 RepID=A0AAV1IB97_9CHLO|nr:hypothetical protein CVIRNUC_007571 [Coccomyxa viridis]